jgi:hypothetical protein
MRQFTEWTPELAYFLGWMITDGYLSDNAVHIELAAEDREPLEHLKQWYPEATLNDEPYKRVKDGVTTESFRLTINSKEIRDHLENHWGIKPNKTGSEEISFEVPDDMVPHLLRGIFDGDGGCTEKSSGKHESYFGSPSKKLLEQIKNIHGGNTGRKIRTKRELTRVKKDGELRDDLYTWEFGKRESRKLREMMYSGGHYGMSRKKDKMFRLF